LYFSLSCRAPAGGQSKGAPQKRRDYFGRIIFPCFLRPSGLASLRAGRAKKRGKIGRHGNLMDSRYKFPMHKSLVLAR
jgi:hypothetical protein